MHRFAVDIAPSVYLMFYEKKTTLYLLDVVHINGMQ